jgi:hypothetical protein
MHVPRGRIRLSFARIQSPRSLWSFHAEPVLQIRIRLQHRARDHQSERGFIPLGRIKWATRRVGGLASVKYEPLARSID